MMTDGELADRFSGRPSSNIPFDIKDVRVDYQCLRKRPKPARMDLLLVAAKKDQSRSTRPGAKRKLKPVICDIDAFTVQNLFEYSRGLPADQTIAVINVGASLSSLTSSANG